VVAEGPALDVDAYLRRIGHEDALAPTLASLSALLDAHMRSIPFENLDVLLGRPIVLELDSLQDKLVRRRRGGYCYEHASLFAAVLESIGARVWRHAARVRLRSPLPVTPRTHMLLQVEVDEGRFLVDPGFGGPGPRVPLPAGIEIEERTPSGHFRLRETPSHWELSRLDPDEQALYHYSLEELPPVDFVVANHFTSTFPASPFRHRLMVQRATHEGGVGIMNELLTVRRNGQEERIVLADRAALRGALKEHFGIDVPEVESLVVPSHEPWSRPPP
jgi:N-hydroxyarylamine O-acetyltransferase